jgi:phage shock protein A
MEQAIREVEGAIDEVRAELGRSVANKHLASKRMMEANRRHEDLTEKIDLAVRQHREDLANAAIGQQLDIEAQIPVLESTIAESAEEEKRLEGMIGALLARKREMKHDLAEYRQSRAAQQSAVSASGAAGRAGGASDVETRVGRAGSAFDRVYERQTGLAGHDHNLGDAGKLAELEDMARKNRIQERLAAAKARVTPQP